MNFCSQRIEYRPLSLFLIICFLRLDLSLPPPPFSTFPPAQTLTTQATLFKPPSNDFWLTSFPHSLFLNYKSFQTVNEIDQKISPPPFFSFKDNAFCVLSFSFLVMRRVAAFPTPFLFLRSSPIKRGLELTSAR